MAQGMYLGGQADLFACGFREKPNECGQHKTYYSYIMIALMSPLFLIPDFKKLSAFSGFFIFCCIVSLLCIFAFEIDTLYKRSHGESVALTFQNENGKIL